MIRMNADKEENKRLCERYPFLIPWNRWSGMLITEAENGGFWPGDTESIPEYDYEYTELDEMPVGWRKAFGEKMCEEIRQVLIEDDDLERWRIVQLKEKYGALRLYDNGHKIGSRIDDVIGKYENISMRTCIRCGKPATKVTKGWVAPYCDNCVSDENTIDIDEYYETEEGE